MGKKQPPPQVLEALRRGDEKAHRAMSKKGGDTRGQQLKEEADLRAFDEAEEKYREEQKLKEFEERDRQANLHTHPID